MRAINLKGKTVGSLYVIQRVRSNKRPKWRCECLLCGNRVTVNHNRLIHKTNPKVDCGCSRKGPATIYKKEYHAWWDAKNRCHYDKHPSYGSYGAKGIRMCAAWRESKGAGFQAFLDHIGPCPSAKYSLDRTDPHGNYEPGNVRWTDDKTQARNKKNTKMIVHPQTGKTVPAAEAAEDMNMRYQTFRKMMVDKGKW